MTIGRLFQLTKPISQTVMFQWSTEERNLFPGDTVIILDSDDLSVTLLSRLGKIRVQSRVFYRSIDRCDTHNAAWSSWTPYSFHPRSPQE